MQNIVTCQSGSRECSCIHNCAVNANQYVTVHICALFSCLTVKLELLKGSEKGVKAHPLWEGMGFVEVA